MLVAKTLPEIAVRLSGLATFASGDLVGIDTGTVGVDGSDDTAFADLEPIDGRRRIAIRGCLLRRVIASQLCRVGQIECQRGAVWNSHR